jgi:membrane-bound lytic murein transglycosylase D
MNPSLRRIMTPPRKFDLKIPARSLDGFHTKLAALPESERVAVAMHKVARGESLNSIARKYHVNAEAIRLANRLPSRRVSTGTSLVIPLGSAAADPSLYAEEGRTARKGGARVYKVKRGDSLASISRRTGIPVAQLKKINDLASNDLRPGQRLVLDASSIPITPAPTSSKAGEPRTTQPKVHHVVAGDTLWDIARHYRTTVNQLCRANRITASHKLHLGDTIVIP